MQLEIRRFDRPDERREFPLGSFEWLSRESVGIGS